MERPSELVVPAEPVWVRSAVLVPAFVLVSLVAGSLPSFSLSANLLVLCTGGLLFWLGVSTPMQRPRPLPRLPAAAVWWIVPFGLLTVVEAVTFLLGSTEANPTLSRLADPVLERYLARSALFFGWTTAFWGLVKR
ncbi:MAG: hypothetical protein HKP61_14900 [Dactylosporangium sp.]|nr:hypothetical protein [Dactylosporangium sp.]NNJ62198.1 hypothetical protein [Dactylosporangium sp.]